MKKLQQNEMKKVKGGAPPFCVRICQIEYNICRNRGGSLTQCGAERTACIKCECDNIC